MTGQLHHDRESIHPKHHIPQHVVLNRGVHRSQPANQHAGRKSAPGERSPPPPARPSGAPFPPPRARALGAGSGVLRGRRAARLVLALLAPDGVEAGDLLPVVQALEVVLAEQDAVLRVFRLGHALREVHPERVTPGVRGRGAAAPGSSAPAPGHGVPRRARGVRPLALLVGGAQAPGGPPRGAGRLGGGPGGGGAGPGGAGRSRARPAAPRTSPGPRRRRTPTPLRDRAPVPPAGR